MEYINLVAVSEGTLIIFRGAYDTHASYAPADSGLATTPIPQMYTRMAISEQPVAS